MLYSLSREEEIIFRELKALSGDMEQIADNLVRHHKERLKEAEARRERTREAHPSAPMPFLAVQGFDRPALLVDLRFIQDRLSTVIKYAEGGYVPPYDQGEAKSIR